MVESPEDERDESPQVPEDGKSHNDKDGDDQGVESGEEVKWQVWEGYLLFSSLALVLFEKRQK